MKNKEYLIFVSSLPCICTGKYGESTSHHLMKEVKRGLAMKSSDEHVLPLHYTEHDALHRHGNETVFFATRGIHNPLELAREIYEHTGDFEYCETLIMARFL